MYRYCFKKWYLDEKYEKYKFHRFHLKKVSSKLIYELLLLAIEKGDPEAARNFYCQLGEYKMQPHELYFIGTKINTEGVRKLFSHFPIVKAVVDGKIVEYMEELSKKYYLQKTTSIVLMDVGTDEAMRFMEKWQKTSEIDSPVCAQIKVKDVILRKSM